MRIKTSLLMVLILALNFTGCASVPRIPERKTHDTGGILIEIEKDVSGLVFMRVEDAGEERLYKCTKKKLANFSKGNCQYLLGVRPGRYVAVAALKEVTTFRDAYNKVTYFHALYFDQELIKLTEIEVKPNQLAVVGRFRISENATPIKAKSLSTLRKVQKYFVIGESLSPEDIDYEATGEEFDKAADAAQGHYRRVINPLNRLPLSRLADLEFHDTLQETRIELLNQARSDLHGSSWAEIVMPPGGH